MKASERVLFVAVGERWQAVDSLLAEWGELHQAHCRVSPAAPSQPAFRAALYRSELRFAILPDEYHCRFIYPFKLTNHAKVLHGRHPDVELVAKRINHSVLPRVGEGYLVELHRHRQQQARPGGVTSVARSFARSIKEWWRLEFCGDKLAENSSAVHLPPEGIPNGGTISLL